MIGWLLLRCLRPAGRRRAPALSAPALLAAVLLVALVHLAGFALLAGPREAALARTQVLVVQPAIPTREKFQLPQQRLLLRRLTAAQRLAAATRQAGEPLEVVLMPEGALPLDQPLPEPAPVELLSGGFRRQGAEVRSSLLRFAPGDQDAPSGWIDKSRLVPLGEWVPLADLWRWGGLSAVGGVEPGSPARLLARPRAPVGVAICYEIADGAGQRQAVRQGARWLLASANLDPYPLQLQRQFEALARLRALETGRWLVSSANTGPSLVVDERGRLRGSLPPGRPATALLPLELRSALTPMAAGGISPCWPWPWRPPAGAGAAAGRHPARPPARVQEPVRPRRGERSTWASKASASRSSRASRWRRWWGCPSGRGASPLRWRSRLSQRRRQGPFSKMPCR